MGFPYRIEVIWAVAPDAARILFPLKNPLPLPLLTEFAYS